MAEDTQKTEKPMNRVKVKLKKNHTHKGKMLKPGDTMDVREDQVKWLKSHGIIE
ncbi:hypothetical protein Nhal_1004 [Nitrosococcus halophilus Nc 4]|uniref:DUF7210 domain-containing protein n=1 Tax=Nitrosococcus halophilus (strain Nc4) TaxID=472759 RepID=D5BYW4_NITHN|nr:hypothetical protein [Nitrosococcus halophilus]ADE14177.1 hypothetical protein Nhal_1004 [Nitrosococcus halophilus Nc 4]